MSNVSKGDLARIIGFDHPNEERDVGKVVAVGDPDCLFDGGALHWYCTSLSGPLMFEWCENGRPCGEWGEHESIYIEDRHLKRIPPGALGMEDELSTSRSSFEFIGDEVAQ